jgi:hypothetical protein
MKTTWWVILSLGLLIACETFDPETFTHYYTETQCSDPWLRATSDSATLSHLTVYLADSGITVLDAQVRVVSNGFECQACPCETGRIFDIRVAPSDTAALADLFPAWKAY